MKYIIVGGDGAGMSAAMQIMKYDTKAEITILESGGIYSYAQCGLPYAIGEVVSDIDKLIVRSAATYREKFNFDARIYHEVTNIDVEEQLVFVKDLQNEKLIQLQYDRLLIASGAKPFLPDWIGNYLQGVHTLKTIPDAETLKNELAKDDINHITVVGGGYIGLEITENLHLRDKNILMLIRGNRLASIFDKELAELITTEARKHNVEVAFEEEISKIIGSDRVTAIETNKRMIKTDLVLAATGVDPHTDFLRNTSIKMTDNGAIHVNKYLQTNITNVYAAGDCALQYNIVKNTDDYTPLGTNANKQGRIAGMNMAGKERKFAGIVGTSIMQFFQLTLGRTGLTNEDAAELKIPYDSVTIEPGHRSTYYPETECLTLKLTYRTDNGLLLGGQVIGQAGIDKRIDVLATALFNKMTVQDLEDLDLSYAPPYNTVWDPIQKAARKAVDQLSKNNID